MTINERGLELVKHFEDCQLTAYRDEAGVWTIGWGHTGLEHNDGTVHEGRTITQAEADYLLAYDMEAAEGEVTALVKVPLTPDQFSALVSFQFNVGALHTSTLLKLLNKGCYSGAIDEFPRWNKCKGKVLHGLTRRRASERNLFCSNSEFIVPPS